jgi:hypothetical protein
VKQLSTANCVGCFSIRPIFQFHCTEASLRPAFPFVFAPQKSFVDPTRFQRYQLSMNFGTLFEKITDPDFPPGYFYAHLPSLGLTTHGLGIEGARAAAADLVKLWLAEKKVNSGPICNR